VREIVYAGEENFLFVCCKEYDRDLDVQSSWDEEYKISIIRRIEPNTIKIFHALQDEENHEGLGQQLTILLMRDNDFFIDRVNPEAKIAIDSAMHS